MEGEAARRRLAVDRAGELAQARAAVLGRARARRAALLGQLRRGEVADVLVEPVRHERAGDALVPPRRRAHVAHPGLGDVPVVVHVVVVEDHRARDGRQQPADVGVAPGLAIQPRVLLEVGDLLARWQARVAARADELARLLGGLVGVHLVAQQEQAVGPFLADRTEAGARAPRARRSPKPCGCSVGGSVYGGRSGSPTRHEPNTRRARRSCSRVWIVDGGRPSSGGHTRTPSSVTSYGRTDPSSRSLSTTSA